MRGFRVFAPGPTRSGQRAPSKSKRIGRFQPFFSRCPPNWKRIAERILHAKSASPRGEKRSESASVNTGEGALDSIPARIVQRPSPESETRPEYLSRLGCSVNEIAVRSRSHEAITLPRRHTSLTSARLKSYI